jgi:hypothetical protein
MFGHQDNQPTEQNDQAAISNSALDDLTSSLPDQTQPNPQSAGPGPSLDAPAPSPSPQTPTDQTWQHPAKPLDDSNGPQGDVISPAGGYPKAPSNKETPFNPVPAFSDHPHPAASSDDNQLTDATDEGLIDVKQKALDELFPLIDKLDQTSEEHFKTLMMIIQASDNHTLIEKAYQVAQTIDDEKARAQALLDIVNEINYFTQQPEI